MPIQKLSPLKVSITMLHDFIQNHRTIIQSIKSKLKNVDLDMLKFIKGVFDLDLYKSEHGELFNAISYRNILFEPKKLKNDKLSFVSHAHYDHIPEGGSGKVLASEITWRFLGNNAILSSPPNENIRILPAGHVPGATMLYIEEDYKVLYTGDFSMHQTPIFECAKPIKADILFVDATYGVPEYVLPNREDEKNALLDTLTNLEKASIVTYTFGKPQELMVYLRKHFGRGIEEDIYVSKSILKKTLMIKDLMRKSDVDPLSFSRNPKRASIIITNSTSMSISRPTITVSGFLRAYSDFHFYISDHEDYEGLKRFIRGCDPSLVITLWGTPSTERFLENDLGIPTISFREFVILLSLKMISPSLL